MERFDIPARHIERRSRQIVYVKSAEKIGDFLKCIDASDSLLKFEDIRISRDFMVSQLTMGSRESIIKVQHIGGHKDNDRCKSCD